MCLLYRLDHECQNWLHRNPGCLFAEGDVHTSLVKGVAAWLGLGFNLVCCLQGNYIGAIDIALVSTSGMQAMW